MSNLKVIAICLLTAVLMFGSCNQPKLKFPQADIENLTVIDVKVHRYGKTLFELDTSDLQNGLKNIQDEFRFFLDADLDDPASVRKLYNYVSDTQLISIYKKTIEVFPKLNNVEDELGTAFSRFHHFFPDKKIPEVFTYISDMYYEMPVWKGDSVILVALDVYLGQDFPLYRQLGLPLFRIRNMEPEFLVTDIMRAIYFDEISPEYKRKTLLDRMVDEGKMLVFLDAVLPHIPDSIKIQYTTDQINWANKNEEHVWAFLVGNNLLYSTDYQMQTKLLQEGPFTTGFGNDSPARLGAYIGWQIVTDYMVKNPDVLLTQMLNETDSQKILQTSAYKP